MDAQPEDIEIIAQPGFSFEPVFVMRIQAINFAITVREISQGAQQLVIVVQIIHAVILGKCRSQLGAQLIVGQIGNA